jgi:outer membrane biosynthesis protein TonB
MAATPSPQPPKAPPSPNPTIGGGGGDAYLNAMRNRILSFRFYPAVAGPLQLSGIAKYEISIDRDSGQVTGIRLEQSAGAGTLDDIGFTMIRRAAPFGPVPGYFPGGNPIRLTLTLNIGPNEPTE